MDVLLELTNQNNISWVYNPTYMRLFNNHILMILSSKVIGINEIELMSKILYILNTIYEYSGESIIDDDIYDSIQNIYQTHTGNQYKKCKNDFVSDVVISSESFNNKLNSNNNIITTEYFNGYNTILNDEWRSLYRFSNDVLNFDQEITHKSNLVGTLDKCKFVLCSDVPANIADQSNISILERDFFGKHIQQGIIDPNETISVTCELKYDGVSVECEISKGMVKSAITRGDLYNNVGINRIVALRNKFFPNHVNYNIENDIVKFEAIISYYDMLRYNLGNSINYKNPRTCISGLMNRLDVETFHELITLIPLKSSKFQDLPRCEEIEMLNNLYSNRVDLNKLYRVFTGNYVSILYQIKEFVKEAQDIREMMPFMYDGIVVTYNDERIKNILSRVNHVDKFSIAIKFPAMSKITTFRNYYFTVGKDGRITPMAEYDLIEFMGTLHTVSSLHSYKRYKELGLTPGEKIRVDYVNDCMPYISKYENIVNNVPDEIKCPSCNSDTVIVNDMCFCTNIQCEGRIISRTVDMLAKLGFDGVSVAFVEKCKLFKLYDILNITDEFLLSLGFGDVQTLNIMREKDRIIGRSIMDYDFLGALGFTGISSERFKLILSNYDLLELIDIIDNNRRDLLLQIKGIGETIVNTLFEEFNIFRDDILNCIGIMNIIPYKELSKESLGNIRISGFRDKELVNMLTNKGFSVTYGSVTKDTKYLIIPDDPGYTSSKVNTANKYGIDIIHRSEINNIIPLL